MRRTNGVFFFYVGLLVFVLFAGVLVKQAQATTRIVTNPTDDGSPTTLRSIVGTSFDGDVIVFRKWTTFASHFHFLLTHKPMVRGHNINAQ